MRTCSVAGCGGRHEALGFCMKHYARFRKHGDPSIVKVASPVYERADPRDRFEAKVERTEACWLWRGSVGAKDGYGRFYDGERPIVVHRWAYEHFVGPIPDELTIDHLCRVRACCNPAHLEPVTRGENARRGNIKTHCVRGHEFNDENTLVVSTTGVRKCRPCHNEAMARRRERLRQEREAA